MSDRPLQQPNGHPKASEKNDDPDAQYDEFGNFIGELSEDSEEEQDEQNLSDFDDQSPRSENNHLVALDDSRFEPVNNEEANTIVQYEDRKLYPTASEIYGQDVEVRFEQEDEMPIEEPLVKVVKPKRYGIQESKLPSVTYDLQYLTELMDYPNLIRNVALVGNLHSGKTSIADCLIEQTHVEFSAKKLDKSSRYTDSLVTEQQRGVSIKGSPLTLLLPSSTEKSYLINLIDCPGHINFSDEATHALALCDGMILVIDVCEGVRFYTEKLIKYAVMNKMPIVLCLNKIDRFVLELKVAPHDAFARLRTIIDEVNTCIRTHVSKSDEELLQSFILHPCFGNVYFSSSEYGFSFSLDHIASLYSQKFSNQHQSFDKQKFSKLLWGDYYFNEVTRQFQKTVPEGMDSKQKTFVQFVMEPLYKIFTTVISFEPNSSEVNAMAADLGIFVKRSDKKPNQSRKAFMRIILSRFYKQYSFGMVDAIIATVPTPQESAPNKMLLNYMGDTGTEIYNSSCDCNSDGELLIQVTKMFPSADASVFNAFGRVYSGTVHAGMKVNALGLGYKLSDREESRIVNIGKLWIYETRYQIEVSSVPAGNWVLLEVLDSYADKQLTLTSTSPKIIEQACIFRPIVPLASKSVLNVSIEPKMPSELPKMLTGLNKIIKSYPSINLRVEESGEYILQGTGELQLDCALYDLRKIFAEIEIRVSDPLVSFCETIVETSVLKCYAKTPNSLNKFTMISEPLDRGLGDAIENGLVPIKNWTSKQTVDYFTENYNWDLLAAKSVWAFGPDPETGSNLLLDDTLPSEVDKSLLLGVRDGLVQGFQWATREGPLCDDPMRNVKFKLLDAVIDENPQNHRPGQIIPTARRVAYSSFLMSTPRMMEPYYICETIGPADCVSGIYQVLSKRRGHIVSDLPIPGSPLFCVKAYVPAIDSFGLETDLRIHTQGQAFVTSSFNHWQIVPGDPLDKSIVLEVLKPQQPIFLAREFMVKSRRRKGLSEDVSVNKFFDDPMLLELAKQDMVFA